MGLLSRGHSPWWETLGWLALDVAELAALTTVAEHLHRRDDRVALAATMAVALLLGDATIDLLTSGPGAPRVIATAMAVLVELPLALLCGRVAVEIGWGRWRRRQEAWQPRQAPDAEPQPELRAALHVGVSPLACQPTQTFGLAPTSPRSMRSAPAPA